MSTYISFR